eukprot:CAMPEP_0184022022 /NCGR_PEP_ID=MMETSP0954-20121128/10316_1 /TAXON_ID=627963 /ORGANISM="Aplanochytrium sp, Strain PBS07" /LENGTH=44 /DNA_ID= /DNA_START= /DNA_END= /DNA_ORIENTATION=
MVDSMAIKFPTEYKIAKEATIPKDKNTVPNRLTQNPEMAQPINP